MALPAALAVLGQNLVGGQAAQLDPTQFMTLVLSYLYEIALSVDKESSDSTPKTVSTIVAAAQSVVNSSAHRLDGYYINNPNASIVYLNLYDVALPGSVVVGTTAPRLQFAIPASGGANMPVPPTLFTNGIQVATATTAAGNTPPGIGLDAEFWYV